MNFNPYRKSPLMRLLILGAVLQLGLPCLAPADDVDPASAGATPSPPEIARQNYHLVFSDEFKGNTLDESKWQYRIDHKAQSTQLPANVSVYGGVLHLAVKKEDSGGKHYTGSGIISKKEFQYGYYEARFKTPPGEGWHTSFWTMHYKGYDTDPKTSLQEIDICEQDSNKSHSGYSTGVIAWNSPLPNKNIGRIRVKTPDLFSEFHIWGAEFTPKVVKMYFDGKLVDTIDVSRVKQGPQSIWLTVLGYRGKIDDSQLPSEARFSYVRFFGN